MNRELNTINTIVIHCSDSPAGKAIDVQTIDAWHKNRGFERDQEARKKHNHNLESIGYHFVIYVSGAVVTGRALEEVGAHVQGYNKKTIGVCMVGKDKFKQEQWDSLRRLVTNLQQQLPSIEAVVGHRDLSPDQDGDGVIESYEWLKDCPTFEVSEWLENDMTPAEENLFV